jgi:hypothetical protein
MGRNARQRVEHEASLGKVYMGDAQARRFKSALGPEQDVQIQHARAPSLPAHATAKGGLNRF